jgi:hypothetical protein
MDAISPDDEFDDKTAQEWLALDDAVSLATEKLAASAWQLRQLVSGIYTDKPVGVYLHCDGDKAAVCDEHCSGEQDLALVKSAAACLMPVQVIEPDADLLGVWVKAGSSPTLKTVGQWLNFFPGTYPGGIPNHAGPVASMITSGLVGAGLGYGSGWLAEKALPDTWRKGRLRKTLAALGAGVGVLPGLVYGHTNVQQGLPFNDNSLFAKRGEALSDRYLGGVAAVADRMRQEREAFLKEAAFDDYAGTGATGDVRVNVNSFGHTLWEVGADPRTAAVTMGALRAAAQMPGGSGPGWVTPSQMGRLAMGMGAGYLSGALVGGALGLLTGLPPSAQDTLKRTGMYLGVVQAVVPRLFGQQ